MSGNADAWVFIGLMIIIAVWIGFGISRWLARPPSGISFMLNTTPPESGPNVKFLEENGYEVLSGKVRVPIKVMLDDQILNTRVYIDYVVQQDDNNIYIVKLAKEKDRIKWSGSGLRDHFMALAFLHEHISGVLYVNPKQKSIQKIEFQFDD